MMDDYPTLKQDAVQVFTQALRAKVVPIIHQDFEGWVGTMKSNGYTLKVDITVEDCPDDNN